MDEQNQPITNKQRLVNLTIVGIISQVGCLTLVIILLALFGGMFIDNRMGTKPWFTVGLILASIPVSLGLMIIIVRAALKKIKPGNPKQAVEEVSDLGKNS